MTTSERSLRGTADFQASSSWSDSDIVFFEGEQRRAALKARALAPLLTEIASLSAATIVGRYLIHKHRRRAARAGVAVVAAQLRKQGIPLAIARVILLGVV